MKQKSARSSWIVNKKGFWGEKTKNQRGFQFSTQFGDASQTNNTFTYSLYEHISTNNSSISQIETLPIDEEMKRIAKINCMIKEQNLSGIAGYTLISDLTTEAYNHRLVSVPPNATQEIQIRFLPEISAVSLSTLFTWQSNNGDRTNPIRELSNCG